ncbi:MAG: isoprenylcysteine carboxylmethyltransferase family protein [Bacteroidota bacterium]
METNSIDMFSLKKKIAVRFIAVPIFFCVVLLIPAGTLYYWQLYLYAAVCLIPMIVTVRYFLKNDPAFLERRMKMREQVREQKRIVSSGAVFYVIGFLVPGFDIRFGWSNIPAVLVLLADVVVLISYLFIIYVFYSNRYASRIIQVEQEQSVISSGPYKIIRHPMYLGAIVMYLATPVALGSYWGLIPFAIVPVMMVFRIRNEEKILREQLSGYTEYCSTVRYRLIPYLW